MEVEEESINISSNENSPISETKNATPEASSSDYSDDEETVTYSYLIFFMSTCISLIFQQLEQQADELEKQIASDKYLYDVHIQLLDIYRKLGDLKSLREARERFRECFPLTPAIWLAWIKDEIRIASIAAEKENILNLFSLAVQDYMCKYK